MKLRIILPIAVLSILSIISCSKKVIEVRYAPVLYNLVAPDSVERGSSDIYYMFVSVFDPDGLSDVDSVYYQVTKPDGSTNGKTYKLRDDAQFGDSVANDGRFTLGILTWGDTTSQLGNYIFKFSARDKDGNVSNHPQATITMF
jgi:hypothetical protein